MTLEQQINEGIRNAMLARDEAELRGLRAIKAAILLARTAEGSNGELKEGEETRLLQKLAKQRKESLEIFRTQHREDLAKKEEEELSVINRFLPGQLGTDALREAVRQVIIETGASSPADLGKVMATAIKKLGASADGKAISAMARELLSR
ncbi:MAG TPA: GatB/YqeY domain-containing protein [Chitinophagaceae bacterium]|nr:GatB/YqeY domain-containing protein [Chitinophagaceae bacterium]